MIIFFSEHLSPLTPDNVPVYKTEHNGTSPFLELMLCQEL